MSGARFYFLIININLYKHAQFIYYPTADN